MLQQTLHLQEMPAGPEIPVSDLTLTFVMFWDRRLVWTKVHERPWRTRSQWWCRARFASSRSAWPPATEFTAADSVVIMEVAAAATYRWLPPPLLQMESGLRRCGKEAREERKQGHSLPSRCSFSKQQGFKLVQCVSTIALSEWVLLMCRRGSSATTDDDASG